jgi:hypothetical protein
VASVHGGDLITEFFQSIAQRLNLAAAPVGDGFEFELATSLPFLSLASGGKRARLAHIAYLELHAPRSIGAFDWFSHWAFRLYFFGPRFAQRR